MARPWIEDWEPEDEAFWEAKGRRIARRNLIFSIFAEFLGFGVWVIWSVTAAKLSDAGFNFTTSQLFTLTAVPALVGATARFPYTLAVPRFGGRNWTTVSALLLLIPTAILPVLVGNPGTPYWLFVLGAATAGFGGGNFASSMANISFFYPDRKKGLALGLNAAGGNLGVAVAQLFIPIVVTAGALGVGAPAEGSTNLKLAGYVWMPLVILASACAWLFMDNLKVAKSRSGGIASIMRRKQTWVMCWLYIGTFGSFIGYSSGLPLLIKTQFPTISLSIAFLGPLVGSLSRPVGGWLSDRIGGARVTFATFVAMIVTVFGLMFFLENKTEPWAFAGFLSSFVFLFLLTGIGNGSTYRMIPMIYRAIHVNGATEDIVRAEGMGRARAETAAAVGFIGAVGAYGGWLIPQSFGVSTSMTGSPAAALMGFVVFYGTCMGMTWWYYLRKSFAVARAPSLAEARV
ncbi:MAG: NarK family nitrate/nitrite MFS transporter [Actinomycetota bacterium]